jgi:hypothetical protein
MQGEEFGPREVASKVLEVGPGQPLAVAGEFSTESPERESLMGKGVALDGQVRLEARLAAECSGRETFAEAPGAGKEVNDGNER